METEAQSKAVTSGKVRIPASIFRLPVRALAAFMAVGEPSFRFRPLHPFALHWPLLGISFLLAMFDLLSVVPKIILLDKEVKTKQFLALCLLRLSVNITKSA